MEAGPRPPIRKAWARSASCEEGAGSWRTVVVSSHGSTRNVLLRVEA